jgi:uncharacterized membrane protein YgdD (TMEM256/DUF423 family)
LMATAPALWFKLAGKVWRSTTRIIAPSISVGELLFSGRIITGFGSMVISPSVTHVLGRRICRAEACVG